MESVTLNWFEVNRAAQCGVLRRLHSLKNPDRKTFDLDSSATAAERAEKEANAWSFDIEAACAEMAWAVRDKAYWPGGINTYKEERDVDKFEIRHSAQHKRRLIIRADDLKFPDTAFIFVTGVAPTFHIHGFMTPNKVREEWLTNAGNNRPKAWFIPIADLLPLKDLPWW